LPVTNKTNRLLCLLLQNTSHTYISHLPAAQTKQLSGLLKFSTHLSKTPSRFPAPFIARSFLIIKLIMPAKKDTAAPTRRSAREATKASTAKSATVAKPKTTTKKPAAAPKPKKTTSPTIAKAKPDGADAAKPLAKGASAKKPAAAPKRKATPAAAEHAKKAKET
jgi:hypothetical protein